MFGGIAVDGPASDGSWAIPGHEWAEPGRTGGLLTEGPIARPDEHEAEESVHHCEHDDSDRAANGRDRRHVWSIRSDCETPIHTVISGGSDTLFKPRGPSGVRPPPKSICRRYSKNTG